jgi:hypothetical protein
MRVNVPLVAVAVGRVDREMRRVALPLKLLADKVPHKAAVLFERLLVRQRDVEIHRKLRIAALLEALHRALRSLLAIRDRVGPLRGGRRQIAVYGVTRSRCSSMFKTVRAPPLPAEAFHPGFGQYVPGQRR